MILEVKTQFIIQTTYNIYEFLRRKKKRQKTIIYNASAFFFIDFEMLDDYACILYLSRTFQEKYPFLKFPQDIKQMIYHLITSIQVIRTHTGI